MPRFRTSIPDLIENLNSDRVDGRHVDDTGLTTNELWTAWKISTSVASNIQANGNNTELTSISGGILASIEIPYATNAGNIDGLDSTSLMRLDTNNIPTSDNTFSLGSPTNRYTNIYSLEFIGALLGNSSTATSLETPRNISISGDVDLISTAFDGTSDINIPLSISNSGVIAGEYTKLIVDSRGIVTSASNLLPSDVISFLGYTPLNKAGDTVTGDFTVQGNLTITGTTVQVEAEQLVIADNSILLNSNFTTGTPLENSGIEVLRGDEPTVSIRWNETSDVWEISDSLGTYYPIATLDGTVNNADLLDGLDSTYFLDASNLSAGTLPIERLPSFTGDVFSSTGSNEITLNTVSIDKGGTNLTSVGVEGSILSSHNSALTYRTLNSSPVIDIVTDASSYSIDVGDIGTIGRDILVYSLDIWDSHYYIILEKIDGWYDIPNTLYSSLETIPSSYLFKTRSTWQRNYRLALNISCNISSIYDPINPSWNDGRNTGVIWVKLSRLSDNVEVIKLTHSFSIENISTTDIIPLTMDLGSISLDVAVKFSIAIFWDNTTESWPTGNVSGDSVTDNYTNYGADTYIHLHKASLEIYDVMPT